MKKSILFLFITAAFAVNAQEKKPSLKELLYGGKLKLDSTSVIRKSDDLSTKIDTSTKKPVVQEKIATPTVGDGTVKGVIQTNDTAAANNITTTTSTQTVVAPVKPNSKIWKEYSDSLAIVLKGEVLSSKKVKKETYYFTIDTEIGADGSITIANVTCDPENEFLTQQVKERIANDPPHLAPSSGSDGQPRKTKKKYSFNVTKE